MDFTPTTGQAQIREAVAEFADEEIAPRAAEIDASDTFPHELVEEMAELGLLGMPIPETHGGAGLDYHAYVFALEEISRASGGLGTVVAAHTSLACNMIFGYGTEPQRERFLEPLAAGEEVGAFALSEPGAGGDVPAIETTVEPDGDGYRLDGQKVWVSNGSVADSVVVFAKTDLEADHRGISAFVVRSDNEGFSVEGTKDKLGDKGCPTAELRFDGVELPVDRRLGEEGAGFKQALETLKRGRVTIAARGVGIAQAALDAAWEYAGEREQFGQPIAKFQAIGHKLADIGTKTRAARVLAHDAADRKARGDSFVEEAAQAKLYASEVSREVTNEGIQIHGGHGYTTDFPVERFYRDVKLNEIYEGTSEILRSTIADQLG